MVVWIWMTCSSSSSVAVVAEEVMEVDSTFNMVDLVGMVADSLVIIRNKSPSLHHSSSKAQTSSS